MMRYLLAIPVALAVAGPQLVFMALAYLLGGHFQNETGSFLALMAAIVAVGIVTAASAVAWTKRRERLVARYIALLAASSTALYAIGIAVGLTLVVGLVTVSGIFFLLSMPVLLLAVRNTLSRQGVSD
ncbi:MAG: hypothetical protein L0177_02010 [Chloroflexi bacterium]|nr:hypothetical protein [Chloroflexota bacterium]